MIALLLAQATTPVVSHLAGKWADAPVSAVMRQTPTEDGGAVVNVQLTIERNGQKVVVIQETTYDRDARPLRQLSSTDNGRAIGRASVLFGPVGAEWRHDGGAPITVAAPEGVSTRSPHVFWFVRTRPAAGATEKYARFSADTGQWTVSTVTYRGPERIPSLGRMVDAHRIEEADATTWVDGTGRVLRLRRGELLLERVEANP
jgi:hypothetical protein